MLLSYIGPFKGKANNYILFKKSEIKEQLQDLFHNWEQNLFLYKDSAYNTTYYCITPYRQTRDLTPTETHFNLKLSSDQISVEQIFSIIQTYWHANTLNINI